MNTNLHVDESSHALEGATGDELNDTNKSLMDSSITDDGQCPFKYRSCIKSVE